MRTINKKAVIAAFAAIVTLSSIPLAIAFISPARTDIGIYHSAAVNILDGQLPYRDFVLEYPPYSLVVFLAPLISGEGNYPFLFKFLVLVADCAIKCLLLAIGLDAARGLRALLPFGFYAAAVALLSYFYLQRYDAFPVLATLLAIWCISAKKCGMAGAMLAIGVGLKMYPLVLAPYLYVVARQQCNGRRFIFGFLMGLAPALLSGALLPWWRFLEFHADRGLQGDSLYASIVWFIKKLGLTDAQWEGGRRCLEVHGALSTLILRPSRWILVFTVVIATVLACRRGMDPGSGNIAQIARLSLLQILTFVIFNQVFSPQFLIWLLPMAAILTLSRYWKSALAILIATSLTLVYYPSAGYEYGGLNLAQTVGLLTRNMLLVAVWGALMHDLGAWKRRTT